MLTSRVDWSPVSSVEQISMAEVKDAKRRVETASFAAGLKRISRGYEWLWLFCVNKNEATRRREKWQKKKKNYLQMNKRMNKE
jgi:hypothetical protein